ncbi:MAG: bi-domain-containing oxidoreductase [Chitinophagales bacterium]
MKQAIIRKGKVLAQEVPSPKVDAGKVLIKVLHSCISAGTEMSNVNITKKNLIERALAQPQEVKTALEFAKKNGIAKTIKRVKGVLDGGKPTGYSIAGVVAGVSGENSKFQIGDIVAAAGAGIANHAEVVAVPENLVMKTPKGMDSRLASTVTLGGIALQGVRRVNLHLGEVCVVVGAGILGLIALQLLRLSGVRVIVTDIDEKRLAIAKELGAELCLNPMKDDIIKVSNHFSGGNGVDAVLFTAATGSSEPLSQSFQMCKKKGKVVLVGVSGMEINRKDIYAKELDFQISTSYGPGRYDNNYELKGLDYPFSYVRWTENRNMTEYLRLVHEGLVKIEPLIDATYSIREVDKAFESLNNQETKPIIVLLEYPQDKNEQILKNNKLSFTTSTIAKEKVSVALIGVGNFATGMHLPNIEALKGKYHLRAVMSRDGFKAKKVGEQFKADYATTDYKEILKDEQVDLVLISTRHDSHGSLVMESLQAGKHTFVEKPLCVNEEELAAIEAFYADGEEGKPLLMTGFNRRFSKYLQEVKKHTAKRINPLFIQYRMNAGYIPMDHWVHESGGRIVGEGCHIIDVMNFLTEAEIESISFDKVNPNNDKIRSSDNVSMILKYKDGSVANIQYFAVGSKKFPKEYMEVHFDENTIVMEDYKSLKGYGINVKEIKDSISAKGQKEELEHLYDCLKGNKEGWPIVLWDMIQTTRISLSID